MLEYLFEELKYPLDRVAGGKNVLLHAASFNHTTPDAFNYLVEKFDSSNTLIYQKTDKNETVSDIAFNSSNTTLVSHLIDKFKIHSNSAEYYSYKLSFSFFSSKHR